MTNQEWKKQIKQDIKNLQKELKEAKKIYDWWAIDIIQDNIDTLKDELKRL